MGSEPDLSPRLGAEAGPTATAELLRADHVAMLDLDGRVVATDVCGGGLADGDDYPALWARAGASDPDAAATEVLLRRVLGLPGSHLSRENRGEAGGQWWRVAGRHLVFADGPRVLVTVEELGHRRDVDDDAWERSALLDHIDAAVVATDLEGVIRAWNRGAELLYGWSADEAVGRVARELVVPGGEGAAAQAVLAELTATGAWEGDVALVCRDGSGFLARVRAAGIRAPDGSVTGYVGVSVDVTAANATNVELVRSVAEFGAITRSIGDALFTLDADHLVTFANPAALQLLDCPVEEIVGHPLSRCLYEPGPEGSAGQHIGDVTETHPARPAACWIACPGNRDVAAEYVATPLRDIDGGLLPGWVIVLRDVTEQRAQEVERAIQLEQVRWLRMVRHALDHDGFELHAQPIVSLASGQVVQHELLLRMRDPDHPGDLIAPGRFLPTAEAYGLAPEIDHWVLERGLAVAATGVPVEINLSAHTLADAGLANRIERLADEAGADSRLVVIELTETALLGAGDTARAFVDRVHELGFELALDDFGTGYGGFSYLKQFPVDYLKIDIEFVRDAVNDPASRHVIVAVVSLAEAFGLKTIAEGVEDAATLDLLGGLGVDFAQGYHLGRPAPLTRVFEEGART